MYKYAVDLEGKGCTLTEQGRSSVRLYTLNPKKKQFRLWITVLVMADSEAKSVASAINLLKADPNFRAFVANPDDVPFRAIQSAAIEPDECEINDPPLTESPIRVAAFGFG